eukprot:CAMPEP_0117625122 /NCGR_PEP_ID=MMETSP0802-20121206/741_1 /TAXON_ID=38833 /ORGANISM="Micromonas sp., Strain CCMP2099" /LENGTH=39 /DNA_ID= /DNA_START= /DNA_END= /DNA_ORIENTATION=
MSVSALEREGTYTTSMLLLHRMVSESGELSGKQQGSSIA